MSSSPPSPSSPEHSHGRRVARGTAAATIATFVAALSHTIGGGSFPPAPLLALALVLSIGWCTVVTGRRFGWTRVSLAVTASQMLFHGTFALSGGQGGHVVVVDSVHAHHGATTLAVLGGGSAHEHDSGPMILAHLVAALVTIVALRLGESTATATAALSTVVRSLLPTIPALVPIGRPAGVRVRPDGSGFRPARTAVLLGGLRHRGPPAFLAA